MVADPLVDLLFDEDPGLQAQAQELLSSLAWDDLSLPLRLLLIAALLARVAGDAEVPSGYRLGVSWEQRAAEQAVHSRERMRRLSQALAALPRLPAADAAQLRALPTTSRGSVYPRLWLLRYQGNRRRVRFEVEVSVTDLLEGDTMAYAAVLEIRGRRGRSLAVRMRPEDLLEIPF